MGKLEKVLLEVVFKIFFYVFNIIFIIHKIQIIFAEWWSTCPPKSRWLLYGFLDQVTLIITSSTLHIIIFGLGYIISIMELRIYITFCRI